MSCKTSLWCLNKETTQGEALREAQVKTESVPGSSAMQLWNIESEKPASLSPLFPFSLLLPGEVSFSHHWYQIKLLWPQGWTLNQWQCICSVAYVISPEAAGLEVGSRGRKYSRWVCFWLTHLWIVSGYTAIATHLSVIYICTACTVKSLKKKRRRRKETVPVHTLQSSFLPSPCVFF